MDTHLYRLNKRAIGQFIRTGCRRRLRLDLYDGTGSRHLADAPEKDIGHPGLTLLEQGREYHRAKYRELEEALGDRVVRGALEAARPGEDPSPLPVALGDVIDTVGGHDFVLEAEYGITASFRAAHDLAPLERGEGVAGGAPLAFEALRPDILQVRPPTCGERRRIITPSGALLRPDPGDERFGLRIIDIKTAGAASPAHFSELAYYGMALAGWLEDTGRSERFAVLAGAAIWPGAHAGSSLGRLLGEGPPGERPRLGLDRSLKALDQDLEAMPPEVVLGRIRRFFRLDLRTVLAEPAWRGLGWHVDRRCVGCDYLGYRRPRHGEASGGPGPGNPPDERYCWPMAEASQHLSRMAGLTEGACGKLRAAAVHDIGQIAELPEGSRILDNHQTLRGKTTLVSARAAALTSRGGPNVPDRAGISAALPYFADIRVAISADFNADSELTFAFGYRLDYGVPVESWPRGPEGPRYRRTRTTIEHPALVLQPSKRAEGEALRSWLGQLGEDIRGAQDDLLRAYRARGETDRDDVGIQFFLWDPLTYRHLCRVFGRHLDLLGDLPGAAALDPIAWVFPARDLLREPAFVTRSSPVTILSEVADSFVAAPIPHHYGLIDLATALDPESRRLPDGEAWGFPVRPLYHDPLNDQIPPERAHELWNRSSPDPDIDFEGHREEVKRTVRRKLHALIYIAEKLTRMLRDHLTADAPGVRDVFRPTERLGGVAHDAEVLYQHARLMAAADGLEIELLMAMPPHDREARYRSARLEAVLRGRARRSGLEALGLSHRASDEDVLLFRLSPRSREARFKAGEFTWSFLPEADLPALQEMTVSQLIRSDPGLGRVLPVKRWERHARLRGTLGVTILKVDRTSRLLAVEASAILTALIRAGRLQMDLDGLAGRFGILDPLPLDGFSWKLRRTLEDRTGIRNPPLAEAHPLFPDRAGARIRGDGRTAVHGPTPAAEFIWNAHGMAACDSGVAPDPVLQVADEVMPELTQRQREAVTQALTRRLALWWGPPGTGKSRTAQAYITALAGAAVRRGRPLRVAVTAFTWVAIDNVARRLPALFGRAGIAADVHLSRLSPVGAVQGLDRRLAEFVTPMNPRSHAGRRALEDRLLRAAGVTVVAGTVHQLFKLGDPVRCQELFDVMLIDEASQLDVAHAIVAFSKLARGARVVAVGDDLQMSPIHPIEPPDGLDHLVGSIYDFFRHYRRHQGPRFALTPVMLNRSFRSNREIVEFVREAGYGEELEAAGKNAALRIRTVRPVETNRPPGWPPGLPFSPAFARILAPAHPLVAVVHDDRDSSQRNDGEANLAAGLVLALLAAGLVDPDSEGGAAYTPNDCFRRGIGIVTPHRAQQAAVCERLASALPGDVDRNAVFDSVDTVERFQGQEKLLMLASYGLGDAGQIAAEEEFIFSLNRFNVTASRAQAKFIALISRPLVDHLPRDRRALEESRLLKHFVDGFLCRSEALTLPGLGTCELRYR